MFDETAAEIASEMVGMAFHPFGHVFQVNSPKTINKQ